MTEQPGHLNAPDLLEECARALCDEFPYGSNLLDFREQDRPKEYVRAVNSILSVLRKRGLLTEQALELLADK